MRELATKADLVVLATKSDLLVLKSDLLDMKLDLQTAIGGLDAKFDSFERRMTVRLGLMLVAWIALVGAMIKLT